ncbi:hypothetical protein RIF29_37773 [Crotalaria pallida]|uniref:Uncharacterized protein n=1 Tax=Crotalaria pallida TaxID=3830 RepID=A0AAN9DYY0_CROPI
MGRKPYAAKNKVVLMLENSSEERLEPQPYDGNTKHPNPSNDGVATLHRLTPAQQQVKEKIQLQKKSAAMKKYKSKGRGSYLRRSERIKSPVIPPHNSNSRIQYIEDITVIESEKDERATRLEKVLGQPQSGPAENLNGKSMAEKVDYALQKIEALDTDLKLLESKVDQEIDSHEAPSAASIGYRSLYINTQKKLQTLTDENQQLTGKLENALGKIDVYEKENRVLIQVLDKMKEAVNAVVISNLARTTEVAVNSSSHAIRSVSAAKRKRNA